MYLQTLEKKFKYFLSSKCKVNTISLSFFIIKKVKYVQLSPPDVEKDACV